MATITFSIWRLMKENKKPGLRWEYPNKEDFPKELDQDLDSPKGMDHVLVRREEKRMVCFSLLNQAVQNLEMILL